MKFMTFNQFTIIGILLLISSSISAQCAQNTPPNLGNDTILCPGNTLQFDLSGMPNNPVFLWDDGTNLATRTISTPGIYYVDAKYIGTSIVNNGDFSQGNTGFSTNYTVGTGGSWGQLSSPGTYAINTSPSNVHNNFTFCSDHTGNNGNMMIVNGASTPGTDVWCQTVNVTPNTDYEFSTWITNVINSTNVANLQFKINGTVIGNPFLTSTVGCVWDQFFSIWNSGTATSATICVTNLNNSGGGNDFAIDDISFAPVCIQSDTIEVEYNNNPVFTLPTSYDECDGSTLTLDAENVGFDYEWSSNETTQTIQVNTSGTYSVTVSDGGYCDANQEFNVTFHSPPNAGADGVADFCDTDLNVDLFSLLDPSIDASGTWYDQLGNPITSGQLDISNLAGFNQYDYVLTSPFCPDDTSSFDLDIKTFLSAGTDFTEQFCNDGTVDLNTFISVTNPGTWTSIDGLGGNIFNPNTGVLTLDGLTKGDYTFEYVVYSDAPCTSDTAVGIIQVSELAQIQFISDLTEGCSPLTVNFSDMTIVNGSKNYTWYVDGVQVGTDSTMTYLFDDVRCYDITLSIETDNLCLKTYTESQMICVNPDPIADFKFSPASIFSDNPVVSFTNESQLNANNIWDFSGLGGSNEINPDFTFPFGEEGDYEVTLTVYSPKGCVDSTTQIIPIRDQTIYYVPNAFTPDGDNINNVFKPVMTVGIDPQMYKFEVFNRWGEKVFESNDYEVGWDGTYGGQLVKDGMYNWKITFTELKTELVITQMGTVTLLK
ncbi:T9SS type B sorting domain-containing protein [Brumimicrobium aurantiacum]|uniref:PKD domain-containing protein n=1 Tax=Brumimicrobium aurantiacum TaxID=1737063 RepID=A0A3E1F262_9FLAO|nr:gliding motility-associated C-terminal domain-containing protein [Brumimicrobium aurantiacum]RFC55906.1 hypothetical protein DXU93_02920 [Brumimicrobium aurantiacum]